MWQHSTSQSTVTSKGSFIVNYEGAGQSQLRTKFNVAADKIVHISYRFPPKHLPCHAFHKPALSFRLRTFCWQTTSGIQII